MKPCIQMEASKGILKKTGEPIQTGGEQRSRLTWIWEKVPNYAEHSLP